jgi:hypothetical protein
MVHSLVLASALGALSVAPFQCPAKPDPSRVREDTPGEALYDLADQFGKAGDKEGKIRTLSYLAQKYPRSRFAVRAREDLRALGVTVREPEMAADPEREGVPFGRLPTDATSATPSGSGAPSAPKSGSAANTGSPSGP